MARLFFPYVLSKGKMYLYLLETSKMTTGEKGRLLCGAREIAKHLFNDEGKFKKVYGLVEVLPIFPFNGMLAAYEGSIDKAMSAKEEAAAAPRPTMGRQRPRARARKAAA
jgi:hypothetical protein